MITFIANTGIQLYAFPLEIDTADGDRRWFREHQDAESGDWILEMMHAVKGGTGAAATDEDGMYLYEKSELIRGGYFAGGDAEIDIEDLRADGIQPVAEAGNFTDEEQAQFFEMHFGSRDSVLESFENVWLPLPMFFRRGKNLFDFGPYDWVRIKLIPVADDDAKDAKEAGETAGEAPRQGRGREKGQKRRYTALLAVDTRTRYNGERGKHYEAPTFPDNYQGFIEFGMCRNELYVMDYCMPNRPWSYVDEYLRELVHPGVRNVAEMRLRRGARRLAYSATYVYLMNFLARNGLIPDIRIYKDRDVRAVDVDMVIDVGNSRTTALLVEDNRNFNQVSSLRLADLTDPVADRPRDGARGSVPLTGYSEPFDMRLAFRRASFGDFGLRDTRQFVYPSLVRVGVEADKLVHRATGVDDPTAEPGIQRLTTYSSPKRYLWDGRPQTEEWRFVRLPGETGDATLNLPGLTPYITSDGRATAKGDGGTTYHYSRRSLMTFAFLEMLVQARMYVNSIERRSVDKGLGHEEMPRRIRRIIVTCPTAMSKLERDALVRCADDAVTMLAGFDTDPHDSAAPARRIEVIPHRAGGYSDEDDPWFYDEATCSQLVYIYGEAGHKYKGCASEFFRLYGKEDPATGRHTLTIGSLDIGAGTSDLMISKYDCEAGDVTTLTPEPQFYDSFYFAGDDMLHGIIKNYMLLNESGAFREALGSMDSRAYRQLMKDFFGPDHSGQTVGDRRLRRDFNMQYSVPLMYHMLQLLNTGSDDRTVTYDEVFGANTPAQSVIDGFRARTGIDVTTLRWQFDRALMSKMVRGEFEPLLKKVSTIMYAHACDLVLLSGRPASLPVIRDIFMDYYTIEPNRLIVLNNYYVGDWYPFSNNTGYITNPKTIVAMGAVIAHYASELSNLNRFVINIDKLKRNLHSTAQYIEASREGQPVEYFITPGNAAGHLTVSRVPTSLRIRQLGMDSYPSRVLYTIDFNRFKIADRVRRVAFQQNGETLNDAQVMARVQDEVDKLKCRMPFNLEIERDIDNPETLDIVAITDRNENPVSDSNLEIHVQSLGADEDYWLDTGAFEF